MVAPAIEFDDHNLSVRFDQGQFGIDAYKLFLKVKAIPEYHLDFDRASEAYTITAPKRFAGLLGVTPPASTAVELPFSEFLMDDQRAVAKIALEAKRYACWSKYGWGKTLLALEFARHVIHRTGGRVLIVTLNDIVEQHMDECRRFYGDSMPIHRITSRAEMREWCKGTGPGLAITNYEKFNPEKGDNANQVVSELRYLAGLILDESSRLKTGGGRQKWAIIKSSKGIEYKLSCTATPAPNDTMEFASQAAFLERMRNESEIIWTYFQKNKTTKRWTVKKHARSGFLRFLANWAIYIDDPRKYGWRPDFKPVPKPIMIIHEIPSTEEQLLELRRLQRDPGGQLRMFGKDLTNAIERVKLSEVGKGFIYELDADGKKSVRRIPSLKPAFVAQLAADELKAGRQTLIWTLFDAETDLIAEQLKALGIAADVMTGRVPKADRHAILQRFRKGECPLLIGRAKMIGFGQNFQKCKAMIYSGWNDSFEELDQSIHRAVRQGQTDEVRVHMPCVRELEGDQLDNVLSKEAKFRADVDEMEANFVQALKGMLV